ncbi:hypothetical protein [Streptomyces acidiscabies]|uniref:Uncharacterized protein n=2 Tax=Streptomyces acidiscabies TaxID=42234 RepID=A0AAP6BKJ8_9ACTN|nr:hypothetical protein [Streptomyces acidiscabies]MBP5940131.1 hypothetical protein [Streptomyces sp. LBUM 1476]MBZ3911339.1 hypothetical protein [Streptomyces acidiscabies]MDX2966295.1 hypothetical protein [Streptomyces acidiscabies]MDX3025705.1 hypothetical protein [Streptomyces acidiscabies]MDX3796286.1 hypothetical protein [Streptomyces acidiscabies]
MQQDRSAYFEMGYSDDFGITGLAEQLCSRPAVDLPAALTAVGDLADGSDGEEAVELGEDARRLLDGLLPEEVLHTVWLAAVGRVFDPADHGMDTRAWLRAVSDVATNRLRRNRRSYAPPPVRPVRDEALCREIVAEVRGLSADLVRASFASDLAAHLEQVIVLADADVGFRFFLRALKTHAVCVSKERYDRFLGLGERLGYPVAVVRDGLTVDWPPIDTTHRQTSWDFGFSRLAGSAHQDWRPDAAVDEVHMVAYTDEPRQPPGTTAALLLEDALRLLRSPLSDNAITALWIAVSDAALRIDGRDWLRLIATVCEERLREVAPAYTPVTPPARTELTGTVLAELREVALTVGDKAISPHWQPLPAVDAMTALEQVIERVDPDLGFRLFLRVMWTLCVRITREQYQRYEAIGERFGYGEYHVNNVEDLVE